MIKTIEKIPKRYKCKDKEKKFKLHNEEDVSEFMCFLLNYHPWEAVMTIHKNKQVLLSDNEFQFMQDVGDNLVYPIITVTKSSFDQGCVVKFQKIVQDAFLEYYPAEYKNEGTPQRILNRIARAKSQGAQLFEMKQLSGCSENQNKEQLPQRFLISKQCHDGTEDYDTSVYNSDAFHGFICEDAMCFKVKVLTKTINRVF